jgi:hypothetical protein
LSKRLTEQARETKKKVVSIASLLGSQAILDKGGKQIIKQLETVSTYLLCVR